MPRRSRTRSRLWRTLDQAGAHLRTRPERRVSVLECLGHMTDSELVNSARYRWVLAESEPALVGYDQEAWWPVWTTPRRSGALLDSSQP